MAKLIRRFKVGTEAFRSKKGELVRTRPANVKFLDPKVGPKVMSRGSWAERLKSERKHGSKKEALKLKRTSRQMTNNDRRLGGGFTRDIQPVKR